MSLGPRCSGGLCFPTNVPMRPPVRTVIPVDQVADTPSDHSVGHEGGCSFLFMGRALRTVAFVTISALLSAACGTNDDIASPDPTITPVTATSAQLTAEPLPAPTPTPEPTLYVHGSGLAC